MATTFADLKKLLDQNGAVYLAHRGKVYPIQANQYVAIPPEELEGIVPRLDPLEAERDAELQRRRREGLC